MKTVTETHDQSKYSLCSDWQSEFNFDTRFNRKIFKVLGLWPSDKNSEEALRRCSIALCTFFLCAFLIPHGLYVFLVEHDNEVRLNKMGPLCFCLITCGKYMFAVWNRNNFAVCVKHMIEDWQEVKLADEREFMLQASHWSETFTKFSLSLIFTSAGCHTILLPFVRQVFAVLSPNGTRTLEFPIYLGCLTIDVATDQELLFNVAFLTLSISMLLMCTITSGMVIFLAKVVMHSCGQIHILRKYLLLFDGKERKKEQGVNFQANLKTVVIKHLRILRFISTIEDAFAGVSFVACAGSSFTICLLGYYMLKELERENILNAIVYMCILMSDVSNIFIFCFISDRLTEQCREIGFWVYEIDWSILLAKEEISTIGLQLITLVSQYPPKLTAGKIFYLTMESFTKIMKAAATYLNLLRKFM